MSTNTDAAPQQQQQQQANENAAEQQKQQQAANGAENNNTNNGSNGSNSNEPILTPAGSPALVGNKPAPSARPEEMHPPPEKLFDIVKPATGKWMTLIGQLLKPPASAANNNAGGADGDNAAADGGGASENSNGGNNNNSNNNDGDASDPAPPPEYCNRDVVDNLCSDVMEVFKEEESLLDVRVEPDQTLVIVGDVHGQFMDLIYHILTQPKAGLPDRKFLFMGDYVDRGPQGVETIMLLFALKCEFPKNIFILRGNHEEAQTSRFYGFLVEVRSKFSDATVWARFVEVFCHIPLAALVTVPDGRRFLCVHGGLSPQLALAGVEGIRNISRSDYQVMLDNEESSIVDGLLWSDPTDTVPNFWPNERGCGYLFGPVATKEFCEANKLQFLCRAHQMTMEGYTWTHDNRCLTVFSAPNYCRISGNLGAVVEVSSALDLHFRQYNAVADSASPPAGNFAQPRLPFFA